MKKILVPCDFSGPSVEAFKLAAKIASKNNAEIFLLNVVEMPVIHSLLIVPVQAYETSYLKGLKEKAMSNFMLLKNKWAKNVKVNFDIDHGVVAKTINKYVSKNKIDMLIMGTHGTGGFREFAVGSNTEKIVRTSKVPVIAIRHAPATVSFKDIILPYDLESNYANLAAPIKELQSFFKAKLHILYVNNGIRFQRNVFIEKKLNEFIRQNKFKNFTLNIYNDLDAENGIINFSRKFDNKMLVMYTHGRKGLAHLLSGSVTEDVVNHLDCPIWTYAKN